MCLLRPLVSRHWDSAPQTVASQVCWTRAFVGRLSGRVSMRGGLESWARIQIPLQSLPNLLTSGLLLSQLRCKVKKSRHTLRVVT